MNRLLNDRVVGELQEKIALLEGARPSAGRKLGSTGLEELDGLFPEKGLNAGMLTEWLGKDEGCGAATLCLLLAACVQRHGGVVGVIESRREFYPPAAQALGISLPRTLVVRTPRPRDGLWAWEQLLRSSAMAAVVGCMERLDDRGARRLQLAAQAGGSVGFLLRPASCRQEPSWAQAKFLVEGLPSDRPLSSLGRRLRVEHLYGRGCSGGRSIEVELSDETGVVRLVSPVAHSAASAREARA